VLGATGGEGTRVVVKSIQHFFAGFALIARAIRYVAAPGATPPIFESIPLTKRTVRSSPRVEDPFTTVGTT
jgi:microcystin degradation protein MlrC